MESLTADGYILIFHDYGDSHSIEKNFQEDLRAEHLTELKVKMHHWQCMCTWLQNAFKTI